MIFGDDHHKIRHEQRLEFQARGPRRFEVDFEIETAALPRRFEIGLPEAVAPDPYAVLGSGSSWRSR
jgi:hypothetical protein